MFKLGKIFFVTVAAGLLVAACGGQAASKPVEVTISLTEFGIESSLAEFNTGVPYHFVVTNAGLVDHEIMIMPPLMDDGMSMDMEEMDEMALAMIEADELTPSTTQSFDYTFTEAASAGSLEFACHTTGHYEAGMKLPIIVK